MSLTEVYRNRNNTDSDLTDLVQKECSIRFVFVTLTRLLPFLRVKDEVRMKTNAIHQRQYYLCYTLLLLIVFFSEIVPITKNASNYRVVLEK